MNESTHDAGRAMPPATREEMMAALFANMVIQQTNMAMMMLGRVAHPETGQYFQDFEAAQMFIDQLEMLEAKTKGNLSRQEEALLKQGLTALRMAFVEATSENPAGAPPHAQPEPSRSEPAPAVEAGPAVPAPASTPSAITQPAAPPEQEESRKKFSKKY